MRSPLEGFEDIDQTYQNNIDIIKRDIDTLHASVTNSLLTGDAVYGKAGSTNISQQVKDKNSELKEKKEKLKLSIKRKDATIERSNRDFSDVKNTLPETHKKKILNVLDDYTIAFLMFTYFFMLLSIMYVYVYVSEQKIKAILKSTGCGVFVTCVIWMLIYYFM